MIIPPEVNVATVKMANNLDCIFILFEIYYKISSDKCINIKNLLLNYSNNNLNNIKISKL